MKRPTQGQREMRALQDAEVRASDDGDLVFEGYAAVYGQPSQFMGFTEYNAPGAFDAILATDPDVRMLGMNHDPSIVFARTKSGTLVLASDERGLKVTATLARTPASEQLAVSVRRGDVDAMSYGFAVGDEEWDESDPQNPTRTIRSYRALFDVSPVAFAAFEQTTAQFRAQVEHWTEHVPAPVDEVRDFVAEAARRDIARRTLKAARLS